MLFRSVLIIITFSLAVDLNAQTHKRGFLTMREIDSVNRTHSGKPYVPINLKTTSGEVITSDSIKGKVTLINFWFKACTGCRVEYPTLNNIFSDLKNNPGFRLITITFDPEESLPEFVEENNMKFSIVSVGNKDSSSRLNFNNGYPSNILIGPDNKIVFVKLGTIQYTKDRAVKDNVYYLINDLLAL